MKLYDHYNKAFLNALVGAACLDDSVDGIAARAAAIAEKADRHLAERRAAAEIAATAERVGSIEAVVCETTDGSGVLVHQVLAVIRRGWPGMAAFAADIGISDRTASRVTQRLRAAGLIAFGQRKSYVLTDAAEAALAARDRQLGVRAQCNTSFAASSGTREGAIT